MPILKWFRPAGTPVSFALCKPLTTIGRALSNDVAIAASRMDDIHVQVAFDGRDFNLEEANRSGEILINGKKKRRARLVHGDRLTLADTEFLFSMFDEPRADRVAASSASDPAWRPDASGASARDTEHASPHAATGLPTRLTNDLSGLRKLYEFSETLMTSASLDDLLETMLRAVIDVTGAEKGFVLLADDHGRPEPRSAAPSSTRPRANVTGSIRASVHMKRDAVTDQDGSISDSIVQRVFETGRPLIVSDALSDDAFCTSQSVVALQLSSVMCAPLMSQGQVTGALYVGNDRVKGLFQKSQLDLLSIFAGQASLILQNAILLRALRADKEKLTEELSNKHFGEIIGSCTSMMEIFRKVQKVATTDISVLITGETGTGKELIARELHRRSNRASGPFVVINCGAIPENLIESELFGHIKGAFTGAIASRPGKFQAADKGTLFLDEVGELPLNLQVKLLRALQEREVLRVGDSKTEKVDIRVIAATNRVLLNEVKQGRFREDLYYRLNVVNIHCPPLRERGEDIIIISRALLTKYADETHSHVRGFTPQALSAIRKYAWPGNIRQLENRIRKALVLCEKSLIDIDDLEIKPDLEGAILPLEKAKEEFQRRYVLEVLEKNSGNRSQTARDLGVDPRTIFRYLEREANPMPSGSGSSSPED